MKLEAFLTAGLPTVDLGRPQPQKGAILETVEEKRAGLGYQFEATAINFLLEHKEALNIRELYRIKNGFIDLFLTLNSGLTISVELKQALHWGPSNVARSQINCFEMLESHRMLGLDKPQLGIILFETFGRDWKKIDGGRPHENGW
ncbi:MAG: hypothetical protein KDD06_25860, partial [Phaeodactylibacter sp.]|nr:hypothetical protein [Phaeodactylibacter sp.]